MLIVGLKGDLEVEGRCMRCLRITDVEIYKDNEAICWKCQRIWYIKLGERRNLGKALDANSEEFKKLRKEFLNNNNPSKR